MHTIIFNMVNGDEYLLSVEKDELDRFLIDIANYNSRKPMLYENNTMINLNNVQRIGIPKNT